MKKLSIFICALFAVATVSAQRVAVLDFNAGVGVSQADVDGISAIFNTYFSPRGYTLVERTQIDRVIDEQNFQRGKLTQSQMVRIGEILNVSKVVIGDVNIVMNQYNVDVRVVNVESGTISAKDGATWAPGSSYRTMMSQLGTRLAGKIAINPTAPVTSSATTSTSSSVRKRTTVEVIMGYLKVFPTELGVFPSEPTSVIAQINNQHMHDYDTWRIPTAEELALLRANGYLGDAIYMSSQTASSKGIVLLVTDSSETYSQKQSLSSYIESAGCDLNMKMIYVENGTFQMGATLDCNCSDITVRRAKPVHTVTLTTPYYIAECEVTQAQWQKIMGTTIHQQYEKHAYSDWRLHGVGDEYPMYFVTHKEARTFCQKLSQITGKIYVLPTEAQWEYAARGGKYNEGTLYSGSNSLNSVAWCGLNSGDTAHPVKQKQPNKLGLYDMTGNVSEWCSDEAPNFDSLQNEIYYPSSHQKDPVGPSGPTDYRMVCYIHRGGSYGSTPRYSLPVFVRQGEQNFATPGKGFRVVCLP